MSKQNQPYFIYQSSHLLTPEQIVALKEERKKRAATMEYVENSDQFPHDLPQKLDNRMETIIPNAFAGGSLGLTLPPQQAQHQSYLQQTSSPYPKWMLNPQANNLEEILENQKNHQDFSDLMRNGTPNKGIEPLKFRTSKSPHSNQQTSKVSQKRKEISKSMQVVADIQTQPTIDYNAKKSILLTPAWMAVNACISGLTINDIEFFIEEENASAFANCAMLETICPQFIKRISSKGVLKFDAEMVVRKVRKDENFQKFTYTPVPDPFSQYQQAQVQPSPARRKSEPMLHDKQPSSGPLNWLKIANTIRMMPKKQFSDPVTEETPIRSPLMPPLQQPTSQAPIANRVHVVGCSVQTLRALLFYLLTSEYRFFVPSRTIGKEEKSFQSSLQSMNSPPLFNAQSAYSLAADLNIQDLQIASQNYIFSTLEVQSALLQYFTPFCQRFPPIRRGILNFIESNWYEIRQKPETQQALIRLAKGDFPQGHMALFKLFCRMEVSPNPPVPSSC